MKRKFLLEKGVMFVAIGCILWCLFGCGSDNGIRGPLFAPNCNSGLIPSFETQWDRWYGFVLVSGDPYYVSNIAHLWKSPENGYLIFETYIRNGDDWDLMIIYAEPIGPCDACAFYLEGRGTGYYIVGSLEKTWDNLIIIQTGFEKYYPGFDAYGYLVYSLE